jgi:hypothetical protein
MVLIRATLNFRIAANLPPNAGRFRAHPWMPLPLPGSRAAAALPMPQLLV